MSIWLWNGGSEFLVVTNLDAVEPSDICGISGAFSNSSNVLHQSPWNASLHRIPNHHDFLVASCIGIPSCHDRVTFY